MDAYQDIVEKIARLHKKSRGYGRLPSLVAASKGQRVESILPYLKAGLYAYGENRVQEAMEKWTTLRASYPEVRLHLIGALQSNKVAEAVALFDVIETVDREKIALLLDKEMKRQNRWPHCLVQVNIGKEPQKSGVMPERLGEFLAFCREKTDLPIRGLMCVPPADEPPAPYFALMHELAQRHGLTELSMGMSGDFETAIAFGATEVRLGTALFGARSRADSSKAEAKATETGK